MSQLLQRQIFFNLQEEKSLASSVVCSNIIFALWQRAERASWPPPYRQRWQSVSLFDQHGRFHFNVWGAPSALAVCRRRWRKVTSYSALALWHTAEMLEYSSKFNRRISIALSYKQSKHLDDQLTQSTYNNVWNLHEMKLHHHHTLFNMRLDNGVYTQQFTISHTQISVEINRQRWQVCYDSKLHISYTCGSEWRERGAESDLKTIN